MKTPVAIIGGGPGGAASAMFLAREGISSVIIEKDPFPRFHIGESMSGECGALVRALGLEPAMQQHDYPIKYGLTVYGAGGKHAWYVPVMARSDDWQLFDQSTWQVRRSTFDQLLLDEAVARGATLLRGQATRPLVHDDGSVRGVEVLAAEGGTLEIESEVLLDCAGQTTFLAHHGVTGPKYLGSYDKQIAIFSHVTGAVRDGGGCRKSHPGNTLIFYTKKYHWAWFIPIEADVVSVGVVVPAAYFTGKKESKRDFLIREMRELNPELAKRVADATVVEEVRAIPNYSYQVRRFTGRGFACIGDAHRFVDPIFSFGLYVTIKEARDIVPHIKTYLQGARRNDDNPFADYQLHVEKGVDVLEDMMDCFWEFPLAFSRFQHAKYTELMIDIFAGRLYERQPSAALIAIRKLLKRERTYGGNDEYSVPIGSRFHAERAPLWEEHAEV